MVPLQSQSAASMSHAAPPRPNTLVTHLPCVTLYVLYPENYPSQQCPVFHLSARWLNQRSAAPLGEKLKALFTPGWPVVFEWINYIATELVSDYCKIQNVFPSTDNIGTAATNSSAFLSQQQGPGLTNELVTEGPHQLFLQSLSLCNDLVEHDQYEQHQLFLLESHECGICYERKQGVEFCDPCPGCEGGGLFCKDCIAHYCQVCSATGCYMCIMPRVA